jgi:twitching motility protein PilT
MEPVFEFESSLIFPGPAAPNESHRALIEELVDKIKKSVGGDFFHSVPTRPSFWINVSHPYTAQFRVEHSIGAIDGTWFRLRHTVQERPALDGLVAGLAPGITQKLLSSDLNSGGLIIVCGPPGAGKTTTASACVASRLCAFGGIAWTIEDPPEIHSLNGWHGTGYCTQTEVVGGDEGWERAIRSLLRSQPVATKMILFVGEIRTRQAAVMLLRAAANGFLVITTSFATDLPNGLESMAQMVGDENLDYLASVLKGCLYQRLSLVPKPMLRAQFIYAPTSNSRVSQLLRARQFRQIQDEVGFQVQ